MDRKSWSAPTTESEVHRRASGRRHYNAVRKLRAAYRQVQVARLLRRYGFEHGVQARMARELGVSRATICRDLQHLKALSRQARELYGGRRLSLRRVIVGAPGEDDLRKPGKT